MMKRGVWTLGMRGEVLEYGVKNTLTVKENKYIMLL